MSLTFLFFLRSGSLTPSSSISAYHYWKTVHCQLWLFSNFFVLFSRAYCQNSDQHWNQKLGFFSLCSSSVCSRTCFSLVSYRRWLSSIYWRRSLRIHRLLLTFLSIMIVMWMLQTSLKGIEGVYQTATSLASNGKSNKLQACKIG